MEGLKLKIQKKRGETTEVNVSASPSPDLGEEIKKKNMEGIEATHDAEAEQTNNNGEIHDEKRESVGDNGFAKTVSAVSNDDNIIYPKGLRLTIIIISICCAVFLVALDQTIIATAM
jgi:hypothetical protein